MWGKMHASKWLRSKSEKRDMLSYSKYINSLCVHFVENYIHFKHLSLSIIFRALREKEEAEAR